MVCIVILASWYHFIQENLCDTLVIIYQLCHYYSFLLKIYVEILLQEIHILKALKAPLIRNIFFLLLLALTLDIAILFSIIEQLVKFGVKSL